MLALGRIGWESWLKASGWWERLRPSERPPFAHGAEATMPDGMLLVTSFHPSRQNTNTGKLTRPMWWGVFERIRERLRDGEDGRATERTERDDPEQRLSLSVLSVVSVLSVSYPCFMPPTTRFTTLPCGIAVWPATRAR